MTKKLQAINSIYQHNPMLNKLAERSQLLTELDHRLQQALPAQFSAHCRLANVRHDTLIIHTDNASLASLVRFQAPMLCKTLSSQLDHSFNKLEVKVKPRHQPLFNADTHSISLCKSAADSIEQTALTLDDGPLKSALEKLAKRHLS